MTTKQSMDARIAERRRLEACARWNEQMARRARANHDFEASDHFNANAMACRLRQR